MKLQDLKKSKKAKKPTINFKLIDEAKKPKINLKLIDEIIHLLDGREYEAALKKFYKEKNKIDFRTFKSILSQFEYFAK